MEAGDQVKAFIAGVGDVAKLEDIQGADVVTGDGEGASGELVERADTVDKGEGTDESGEFTPVGVTVHEWARDNIEAQGAAVRVSTLNDECRGDEAFF